MNERRSTERTKHSTIADVLDGRTKQPVSSRGRVVNISRGGMAIITEDAIKPRIPYIYRLVLSPSVSILLEGKLVQARQESFCQLSGIAFSDMSLANRIVFNRHMGGRISSLQTRIRISAVSCGAAALLVAHLMIGLSWSMAIGVGAIFVVALLITNPF